jgi:hypothetical protein
MEVVGLVASNHPEFHWEIFTSNYLRLPDLPLNVYWEDLMASLEMAGPLMDYPIIVHQTIKDR